MEGQPDRQRVQPVLQPGLPGADDYLLPSARDADAPHAARDVGAARRQGQLLRDRGQGRELQQPRRLRLHAASRILAAQPDQATTYSDETTLYYWAACRRRTRTGAAPSATRSRRCVDLPEAVQPARRPCPLRDGALLSESRSSAGARSRELGATASRSLRSRPLPRRSRTSPRPRLRTRRSRAALPTRRSTGECAPMTRT